MPCYLRWLTTLVRPAATAGVDQHLGSVNHRTTSSGGGPSDETRAEHRTLDHQPVRVCAGSRSSSTKPQVGRGPNCGFCWVARGGVEPPTFHFSGGRSYRLSYLAKRRKPYRSSRGRTKTGDRRRFGAASRRTLCFLMLVPAPIV